MSDVETRLAALERRLQTAEDILAIQNLITTYGPGADIADLDLAASLVWTEDGTYDLTEEKFASGRKAIAAMVNSDRHKKMVAMGCAHFVGPPHIQVNGDTAIATAYTIVLTQSWDAFQVWRVSANRFEMVRTAEGWRVQYRFNRLLNGQEKARWILRHGITAEGKGEKPRPPRKA